MFVTKLAEQAEARRLRSDGMSYKRIAARLGVSPASVFQWTKDIQLSPAQTEANLRGPTGPLNPERVRRAAASWAASCRERRRICQEEGRATARDGDMLHQAGCMLYWAEGSKSRCAIEFSNSDARMVLLFRRFLTDSLGVDRETILLSLNVYTNNGLSIEEIEAYWLDLLDLPSSSVRKHMLNHRPTSSSGRAKTSARTASARCACTTPGCSSTSTGRFRSTGVSTNRLGCARAIMSGLGR
jgi:DNA-binding transcriptional regulator YdaS (Cro superfamily)